MPLSRNGSTSTCRLKFVTSTLSKPSRRTQTSTERYLSCSWRKCTRSKASRFVFTARVEEANNFISQLRTRLRSEQQPKKELFNRAMIETYLGNEDSVLQQLLKESEEHVKFVRKMIEREFSHKTEETQNFLKKFSIESFEQLRPTIRDQFTQFNKTELKRKEEITAEKFLEKNNFSHLKLARPNMFEIVRSRALNMNNDDIHKLFKIKFDITKLMRIIRGTFDSYWNLLQVYDNRRATSFCEFAYIWIGSFSVDPEKCKITEQPLCRLLLHVSD